MWIRARRGARRGDLPVSLSALARLRRNRGDCDEGRTPKTTRGKVDLGGSLTDSYIRGEVAVSSDIQH